MSAPAFLAFDWGTSSLRAAALDADGQTLASVSEPLGISSVKYRAFEATFTAIADRLDPGGTAPALLCGMIGSRQGWVEVPYVTCPAGFAAVAGGLHEVKTKARRVGVVGGVVFDPTSGAPDVMRGEETQIFGAIASGDGGDGLYVLPGTHSKWARVVNGEITTFRTFMTGEVFHVLCQGTILGRLMIENGIPTGRGFAEGVAASAHLQQGGDLLSAVFATRTLGLLDRLETYELRFYLSGLLIGAELRANLTDEPVTLIAANTLAEPYIAAADLIGIPFRRAPADAAIIGLMQIARAAGWLPAAARTPS